MTESRGRLEGFVVPLTEVRNIGETWFEKAAYKVKSCLLKTVKRNQPIQSEITGTILFERAAQRILFKV